MATSDMQVPLDSPAIVDRTKAMFPVEIALASDGASSRNGATINFDDVI